MRFKSKRTMPGKHKKLFAFIKTLLVLVCFAALAAVITRSALLLVEKGPAAIEKKIHQATGRNASVARISLHFPNIVKLHHLTITSGTGKKDVFTTKEIACRFSWRCIMGIVEITDVALVEPVFTAQRAKNHFNLSFARINQAIQALNTGSTQTKISLDPLQWPLVIALRSVTLQDVSLRIEDNKKIIPELSAAMDITLHTPPADIADYPLSGQIHIKNGSFSHHGLEGTLTGTVDLLKNLATPELEVHFGSENRLRISGAVRDYRTKPAVHLTIEADSFNPAPLKKLRLPLLPPSVDMALTGVVQINNLLLFKKKFPALNGRFTHANGAFIFDNLELELPDHIGLITGSMSLGPGQGLANSPLHFENYGRVQFNYHGEPLADNALGSQLYGHINQTFPLFEDLAIDIMLQKRDEILRVVSIVVDGVNGGLILEGESDLSFDDMNLTGKFIIPQQGNVDEKQIMPVTIKGSMVRPEVLFYQ